MFKNLPRRKRKLYLKLIPIILLVMVAAFFTWRQTNISNVVMEDDPNSGITSKLERAIPKNAPSDIYNEVTAEAGINFTHFNKKRTSQLIEDMGSGMAWIDYNNDGWDDLFLLNFTADSVAGAPGTSSKLYHNNGDGTFRDVSEQAGLDLKVRGMGTAWADYNNDGWIDALITSVGENRLFRNNGDGTFSDVSSTSGIAGKEGFWAGAAWGDYNRDGDADLYITGYVDYFEIAASDDIANLQNPPSINPSVFPPIANLLYRNNGDGTFTEISQQAGVANSKGKSLQAAWIDLNNDLYPELYVTNDVSDNALYLNMGDGTFKNISYQAKVADYRGSMGLAAGDWDNDEDNDLFITHWIAEENALYVNQKSRIGPIVFRDFADRYGLGQSALSLVGWATSFFDVDNDSRLDLFVVNGHTFQQEDNLSKLVPLTDKLYWNRGKSDGFFDISPVAGNYFSEKWVGRGGGYADYNNDGRLDLFILNHNGKGVLLKNRYPHDHHWLQIVLEGRESNWSALGAKLRLVAGGKVQIAQIGSQGSYLSQNSLVQHFGLGKATRVDSLVIQWPNGTRQFRTDIAVDQKISIIEKEKGE